MTLVELLVTIVIASVGTYMFATQMYGITQRTEMIKRRSALEELKNDVRMLALNRAAINYSAGLPENSGIKDCILGTGKCAHGTTVNFTLAMQNTKPLASPNSYYTYYGVSCPTWNESCPIKVSAVAKAVCNRGIPLCIYAGGVYLVTKMEIYPSVLAKVASYGIRDIMETSLLTLSGAEEGNKSLKNLSCPAGQFMRGVDLVNNVAVCSAKGS